MQSLIQLVRIDEAINALGGVYPKASGGDYLNFGRDGYVACSWPYISGFAPVCTRVEFEARKAERQNKPSWGKAPEWANYMAQTDFGGWFFYRENPTPSEKSPTFIGGWATGQTFTSSREQGEIIGDYRNTLEQRPSHIGEADEKGDVDAAIEAMRDIRTAFANQAITQFKASGRYVDRHPGGLSKVEVTIEPDIDFEWLANQFDEADDINAVWALRDKLHHKNKPEPSPELSFHLSTAFNEIQASARLLPEDDARRAQLVSLAAAVNVIREVV